MTIIVATRDRVVADSRLSYKDGSGLPVTIGKVFKRKGGGLFATAGDCRRTYHFEKAMRRGKDPEGLDCLEDESCDAVLLLPDGTLIMYDTDYCPTPIAEPWAVIGGPVQVAESWLMHGATPEDAIARCIQVDFGCGFPIQVARLDGSFELVWESGEVTRVDSLEEGLRGGFERERR